MAPIRAALDLAKQEKLRTADIASVTIKLHAHAVKKATDPRKNYPRDKETADHSYHYCIAAALLAGACGPAQFEDARIAAQDIRDVIAVTTLEVDADLTALYPASSGGGVVVRLRDGRELQRIYPYPPGHPKNQMTDADVERKLFELTDGVIARARAQQIIEAVGRFERCASIGDVLGMLELNG